MVLPPEISHSQEICCNQEMKPGRKAIAGEGQGSLVGPCQGETVTSMADSLSKTPPVKFRNWTVIGKGEIRRGALIGRGGESEIYR